MPRQNTNPDQSTVIDPPNNKTGGATRNGTKKNTNSISSAQPMTVNPSHIAFIMDGNGRWAKQQGKSRHFGHREGVQTVRRVVELAKDAGINYITLFGFSSENWARPESEVNHLLDLLRHYLTKDIDELNKSNVCLNIIGDTDQFPADLQNKITTAQRQTRNNDGIVVTIALSYGGRLDIVQAVQRLVKKAAAGDIRPQDISYDLIARHLLTADLPDPDMIVRTSGEQRLSNFLLLQGAYSEFYFTNTLWPDFGKQDFDQILAEYARRNRRFGGVMAAE